MATEKNYFLEQVGVAETTLATKRENVMGDYDKPAGKVIAAIADGGWVCDAATDWSTELDQRCAKIGPALDAAEAALKDAKKGEDDPVPEGHEHGLAFKRNWNAYPPGAP